jgi:hypothetical protein
VLLVQLHILELRAVLVVLVLLLQLMLVKLAIHLVVVLVDILKQQLLVALAEQVEQVMQ